jgi:hypothetical protein
MAKTMIDQIIEDIQRTHIVLNAEAGHGKSTALKTIVAELKRKYPKTIVKVFDVSQSWYHVAPLKWRQRITFEMMRKISEQGKIDFRNVDDCVYEMGDLTEELRRFFVAIIVKQDYEVRRAVGFQYGERGIDGLPRIVYIFEEADTYFDSASLNKKDEASATLRDFIKIGRNFGLRAFCVATATVGELGTKFRRRTKHIIGKVISDSDYREYNRMKKGLGKLALELPRFTWIYFNGKASKPFEIPELVVNVPTDYVPRPKSARLVSVESERAPSELSPWVLAVFFIVVGALLVMWFL